MTQKKHLSKKEKKKQRKQKKKAEKMERELVEEVLSEDTPLNTEHENLYYSDIHMSYLERVNNEDKINKILEEDYDNPASKIRKYVTKCTNLLFKFFTQIANVCKEEEESYYMQLSWLSEFLTEKLEHLIYTKEFHSNNIAFYFSNSKLYNYLCYFRYDMRELFAYFKENKITKGTQIDFTKLKSKLRNLNTITGTYNINMTDILVNNDPFDESTRQTIIDYLLKLFKYINSIEVLLKEYDTSEAKKTFNKYMKWMNSMTKEDILLLNLDKDVPEMLPNLLPCLQSASEPQFEINILELNLFKWVNIMNYAPTDLKDYLETKNRRKGRINIDDDTMEYIQDHVSRFMTSKVSSENKETVNTTIIESLNALRNANINKLSKSMFNKNEDKEDAYTKEFIDSIMNKIKDSNTDEYTEKIKKGGSEFVENIANDNSSLAKLTKTMNFLGTNNNQDNNIEEDIIIDQTNEELLISLARDQDTLLNSLSPGAPGYKDATENYTKTVSVLETMNITEDEIFDYEKWPNNDTNKGKEIIEEDQDINQDIDRIDIPSDLLKNLDEYMNQ